MIQDNIKKLEIKLKELKNHPVCFHDYFDDFKRLNVVFPEGYLYKFAGAVRLNLGSKIANVERAIQICEEVWKDSFLS